MATAEEMRKLREAFEAIEFPPGSMGIVAICDESGKMMFSSPCGHVSTTGESAYSLFAKLVLAAASRVAEIFTRSTDIDYVERKGNLQ